MFIFSKKRPKEFLFFTSFILPLNDNAYVEEHKYNQLVVESVEENRKIKLKWRSKNRIFFMERGGTQPPTPKSVPAHVNNYLEDDIGWTQRFISTFKISKCLIHRYTIFFYDRRNSIKDIFIRRKIMYSSYL